MKMLVLATCKQEKEEVAQNPLKMRLMTLN